MFLPSSILCVAFASVWNRYRGRPWLTMLEEAVSPIGVGLLLAGVATLTEIAASTPSAIIIGVLASLVCFFRPQTHPIALLAGGAILNVVAQAAIK
jgi:chromate transport protein ChrA